MNKTPETDEAQHEGLLRGNAMPTKVVTANFARQLERERDDAREQVKELIYIAARAIELAEIDFENDKFGVVSELRNDLEKIKESK